MSSRIPEGRCPCDPRTGSGGRQRKVRELQAGYMKGWAAGTELEREGFKQLMSIELRRKGDPGDDGDKGSGRGGMRLSVGGWAKVDMPDWHVGGPGRYGGLRGGLVRLVCVCVCGCVCVHASAVCVCVLF
jgi:hypothetical protein